MKLNFVFYVFEVFSIDARFTYKNFFSFDFVISATLSVST